MNAVTGFAITTTTDSGVVVAGPAVYVRDHLEGLLMLAGVAAWALFGKKAVGIALIVVGAIMLYLEKAVPTSTSSITITAGTNGPID
jgi:membrane-bound ClpP family serine protease